MWNQFCDTFKIIVTSKSIESLLFGGLLLRIIAFFYGILHDHYVNHIKYTDIDYLVFTNGSKAILSGESPYNDVEYRYSPLVSLIFLPNLLLNVNFGKLVLILADTLNGQLIYTLSTNQGTNRVSSKIFLTIWIFNPVTVAISTRGSFEPILTLVILLSIYYLIKSHFITSGLLYGLSIHLKLYPIIYSLSLYIYLIRKRPYLKTHTKMYYWYTTISPSKSHFKFFLSAGLSLVLSSLVSYLYFGKIYLEQSLFYHVMRTDFQHNFSMHFYLFRLMPNFTSSISNLAFISQLVGVSALSLKYHSFDSNRRIKMKKLTFSLFITTLLFVSLNKVCTSQYFIWYLVFLPLILDSIKIKPRRALSLLAAWILTQTIWLLFAYLHEYRHYNVLDLVGSSSILFFFSNCWIIINLCKSFDAMIHRTKNESDVD